MSGSQGSFVDGLAAAARENPLAAALIGGGALWLLIGSDKLKSAASSVASAAAPLGDLGAQPRGPRRPVGTTRTVPWGIELPNAGGSLPRP